MIKVQSFNKATVLVVMRRTFMGTLIMYAIVSSIMLIRLNPKPTIIGIDSYGTRIIGESGDGILKAEKVNLVKRFLIYLYSFDETNFDERISTVGDFMATKLWEQKQSEFLSISNRLKNEPLTQKAKIEDLREIDDTHFEADLQVSVQNRLRQGGSKIRVQLELKPTPRNPNKPYPWEIVTYDEQSL